MTGTYRYQKLFAFPGWFINLLVCDFQLRSHFVHFKAGVVDLRETATKFVRLARQILPLLREHSETESHRADVSFTFSYHVVWKLFPNFYAIEDFRCNFYQKKKKKLNFLDKISQRCIIREYYYANKLTNDHFCYGFFNFTILKKKKKERKGNVSLGSERRGSWRIKSRWKVAISKGISRSSFIKIRINRGKLQVVLVGKEIREFFKRGSLIKGISLATLTKDSHFVACDQLEEIHRRHVIVPLHLGGHSAGKLRHRLMDQGEGSRYSVPHSFLQRRQRNRCRW